eukprot:gnl/TRDRNA2_/TRDRNA2_175426_c2_seq14.p1 gnl/TRDRNA2_/TRDRNA2_175426_c2~~gnl/TRDRNA2_/TRDRNA2_175426_c2_seq14.p1  ORF type:complete len:252 (-),score=1.89 gnl/TRDRNA2_/TRDRNA2_175426_c2_seq14:327-1082(-)
MTLRAFSVSCSILICNMLLFLCYFSQGIRVLSSDGSTEEQSDEQLDKPPAQFGDMKAETVENLPGRGTVGHIVTKHTGLSWDSLRNIIVMTGYANETETLCAHLNGNWMLIPYGYDYTDPGKYRESKNFVNYWRLAVASLSMQSTVLNMTKIMYFNEHPKKSEISTIPHWEHLKRYMGIGDKWKLVVKVNAYFGLNGLDLNFHLIKDVATQKLHLVEVYKSPLCEMPGYSSYYDWRKLTFPNASSYKWSPF